MIVWGTLVPSPFRKVFSLGKMEREERVDGSRFMSILVKDFPLFVGSVLVASRCSFTFL